MENYQFDNNQSSQPPEGMFPSPFDGEQYYASPWLHSSDNDFCGEQYSDDYNTYSPEVFSLLQLPGIWKGLDYIQPSSVDEKRNQLIRIHEANLFTDPESYSDTPVTLLDNMEVGEYKALHEHKYISSEECKAAYVAKLSESCLFFHCPNCAYSYAYKGGFYS